MWHSSRIALVARLATRIVVLSIVLSSANARASDTGFLQRVYRDAGGKHRYAVFVPRQYTPARKWPVILFLHGAGERGTDGIRPTTVGLGTIIRRHEKTFPFIAVFPQCENMRGRLLTCWNAGTDDGRRALAILAQVESQFRVDSARRILTGWSMGGYGVWSLAAATPQRWSAIVPIAGGGSPSLAAKLKDIPIWAFHGEHDRAVLPETTRKMVNAVRAAGGAARLTIVKEIGHGVWKTAYSRSPLLDWMQNPKRRFLPPREMVARDSEKSITPDHHLVPFVPAVEMSRAITVRLGNRVLKSLAYNVPAMVPKSLLSGQIRDIAETTQVEGRTFNLQLMNISYAGSLSQVRIEAVGRGRLRIQFGLRNVRLNIAKTYVTGRKRWAVAGPIRIVIGHRKPVWLTIDVQPVVVNRQLKLRLRNQSFQIAEDNWSITTPAIKEVHGWGMTKTAVAKSLVKGLREHKTRIEQEVAAIVPSIVEQLEKQIEIPDASGLIAGLWPLPVLRPRVRLWPESASVDDGGVTVSFGITAAAIDPRHAPAKPRRVVSSGVLPASLVTGADLHVGIAPGVLTQMMQILIDAGVARLHVLDLPAEQFAAFVDRKILAEAVPDLKRFGPGLELRSELILDRPMTIAAGSESRSPASESRFSKGQRKTGARKSDGSKPGTPSLQFRDSRLVVSIRTDPKSRDWKPYVEFSIGVSQPLKIRLARDGFTKRSISTEWTAAPNVTVEGRFAKGIHPENPKLDLARIRGLFLAGWQSWSKSFARAKTRVPDIALANGILRLREIDWGPKQLVVTFATPGIKISNQSAAALTYEVKSPNSRWGGPYTLRPHGSHEFAVPFAMLYRRRVGNRYNTFKLPAGSHSVFKSARPGESPRLFKGK